MGDSYANIGGLMALLGLIAVVVEVIMIFKFFEMAGYISDMRMILSDIRRQGEVPNKDIGSSPSYSGEMDLTGKEYFRVVRLDNATLFATKLGEFAGVVKLETNTPDNQYPLAVYAGGRKLGYLRRGNKKLYEWLATHGAETKVRGFVGIRSEVPQYESYRFYCFVYIDALESDKAIVKQSPNT
ncbi:MAG: hypothetical protein LKE54_07560 [Prevotella sp.]|jgi:hypothetical protein|nr:hypothetical protein [Prevotella sp.]MCH3994890.1 hypothetical protein [Prevotella sp.]